MIGGTEHVSLGSGSGAEGCGTSNGSGRVSGSSNGLLQRRPLPSDLQPEAVYREWNAQSTGAGGTYESIILNKKG